MRISLMRQQVATMQFGPNKRKFKMFFDISLGSKTFLGQNSEEYVLLNPSHVVPEFLIHTFFPTLLKNTKVNNGTEIAAIHSSALTVPDALIPAYPQNSSTDKLRVNWEYRISHDMVDNHALRKENLLLSNLMHAQKRNSTDNTEIDENYQSQSNILIKQSAIQSIEQSVAEFRGLKSVLLKQITVRIQ
jgi:hypothetical protein